MKIKQGFVLREIVGEYVIVPTGEVTLTFTGLMTVNEVGAYLWKLLSVETTKEELVNALLDEYDVDEKTASSDIDEYIQYLKQNNILE